MSYQYLVGAEIDYSEGSKGAVRDQESPGHLDLWSAGLRSALSISAALAAGKRKGSFALPLFFSRAESTRSGRRSGAHEIAGGARLVRNLLELRRSREGTGSAFEGPRARDPGACCHLELIVQCGPWRNVLLRTRSVPCARASGANAPANPRERVQVVMLRAVSRRHCRSRARAGGDTWPSAVARTRVPFGAAKSTPVCARQFLKIGWKRAPNPELRARTPPASAGMPWRGSIRRGSSNLDAFIVRKRTACARAVVHELRREDGPER